MKTNQRRAAGFGFRVLLLVVLGLSTIGRAWAAPSAEDRRAAIALADAGAKAFEAGDYERAAAQFDQAFALAPVPSFALWHARAARKLGWLKLADVRYRAAIALDVSAMDERKRRVQEKAKQEAIRERAELSEQIPLVKIGFDANFIGGVSVFVDGNVIALAELVNEQMLDPGPHEVRAVAGAADVSEKFDLVAGERKTITLPLNQAVQQRVRESQQAAEAERSAARTDLPTDQGASPLQPITPQPVTPWQLPVIPQGDPGLGQRITGWVVGGLGVMTMGTGGLLGLLAKGQYDRVEGCTGTVCEDQTSLDQRDKARTVGNVATAVVVVGAAVTVTGVVLLVTAPSQKPRAQAARRFSIGVRGPGAVVQGSF